MIFLIVVLAVGNQDDLTEYGYFYVRVHWTGLGLQENIVEEEVLLSALLHIFVGLERTWDKKLSTGLKGGQLNLAITGLMLPTFMNNSSLQVEFRGN